MQNELKSPRAGVVAAVRVQEGNTVTSGQVLVTLE
jgi:biotin carboxyl carrier protein